MVIPNSKTVVIPNFLPYNEYVKQHKEIKVCSKFPKCSINKVDRIIAVGDIHGDFDALLASLYDGKVIDETGKWIGGNTIVVQVGDILDKGGRGKEDETLKVDDSEWRIICYIEELQKMAFNDGGYVCLLLGNHEVMNLKGDFRYTTRATMEYFGGLEGRTEAFRPGGIIFQKLACMTNGIIKIGSWVFVHAGLIPEALEDYNNKDGLHSLNTDLRDYLLGNLNQEDEKYNKLMNLFSNNEGIIWTRAFGREEADCKLLDRALSMELLQIPGKPKSGGLIVGHTPQMYDNISGKCNNKLFAIDRGMSKAFGEENSKRIEVLEILDDVPVV